MRDGDIAFVVIIGLFVLLFLWHYGKAGWDGVTKGRMYYLPFEMIGYRGCFPIKLKKLEGRDAQNMGCVFLGMCAAIVSFCMLLVTILLRDAR